jgi:lon-related putative ATP-dependent protease
LRELTSQEVVWRCPPESLGFATTAEVKAEAEPIGQERALAALDLGLSIDAEGYNIFVVGIPGTGRSSTTLAAARRVAAQLPAPADWCYVYNFADPRRPRAISLPAGRAVGLRHDMDQFITDLRRAVTEAFESDSYAEERDELIRGYREQRQREIEEFEQTARAQGFAVGRTPSGLILAPTLGGEVMTPQQFAALPEAQRNEIEQRRQALERTLEEIMRRAHRMEREARRAVQQLDQRVVSNVVAPLIEELASKYQDVPGVLEHLENIKADVAENAELFRRMAVGEEEYHLPLPPPLQPKPPFERYRVNVLTTSHPQDGAPVVRETNPTVQNLTGRIEYQAQMGALVTDYTMIHAGALHRANGGYLIVDAFDLLTRPYAWDALKRCLKSGQIRVESLAEHLGLVSTVTLEPEPIPLSAKVIVIGSPLIYYLLWAYDEDFGKLFRVRAEFDFVNPRSPEMISAYAGFVALRCQQDNLPHFTAGAVARVIEQAVRFAEDQEKLSAQFTLLENLIHEAAFWARRAGRDLVEREDVEKAIRQKIWRANRVEQRLMEYIRRGILMVQTQGWAVGQVNGIALLPLGEYAAGMPTRITAGCALGRGGVISIDREVRLTDPIHDKGALILAGFLAGRYAGDQPLSCSISLAFEQSYEEVAGDSASTAELYAILSALSGLPLRQDLAVTGSVDQHGNVQPVGGVNRKIEGFFAACKETGLTGTQGVVIPEASTASLMLDQEVVQAIEQGQFHVYAVRTVDEAIELLTGVPAGERQEGGTYPEGTVNRLVYDRLRAMAEAARRWGAEGGEEEPSHAEEEKE